MVARPVYHAVALILQHLHRLLNEVAAERRGRKPRNQPKTGRPRLYSTLDSGFERRVGLGVLADSRLLIHSLRKPFAWFLFTQALTLHCMSFATPPNQSVSGADFLALSAD